MTVVRTVVLDGATHVDRVKVPGRSDRFHGVAAILGAAVPCSSSRRAELGAGMLAVLKGERSLIGAITIGNPSGVVDHFCADDVKLLETLANNTSVALENDRLGQMVWRLKELQLALDGSGTGYSSLCHLRSLPINWLKIGMPFMDTLEEGGSDRAFVRMVLDLATNLELDVVAEGIESAGQLAALRELGCEFGQGFHLGAPASIDLIDVAAKYTATR